MIPPKSNPRATNSERIDWKILRCPACRTDRLRILHTETTPDVVLIGVRCERGDLSRIRFENHDGRVVREIVPLPAKNERELEGEPCEDCSWQDLARSMCVDPDYQEAGR